VLVKAYNSIGKVKQYYSLLQQAYKILSSELLSANKKAILQIAVKAVNDLAGPDGIVPTLLVFGAYPCMTRDSPPLPFITERAEAIYKAIKKVRRLYAEQQVNNALAIRNKPNTELVLTLSL
jgi:GAF domain-containing protein